MILQVASSNEGSFQWLSICSVASRFFSCENLVACFRERNLLRDSH